jgi:hypothetical protein
MAIVFRFASMNPRQRAVLAVADVEEAAIHLERNFNLDGFSFDEDGDDPASLSRILSELRAGNPVRLHEREVVTDDLVDIFPA